MREDYVKRLVDMMETDAVMISPGEELLFFTDFSPMLCERFQALFVKKDGTLFYLANILYEGELQAAYGDAFPIYVWHDNEGLPKVYEILKAQGIENCSLAVNSTAQTFNVFHIADNLNIKLVDGKPLLEEVRIRKDHEELNRMRRSAEIADSVFDKICNFIRPGLTEKEVSDEMCRIMNEYEDSHADEAMVISGPNSGYPHYMGNSRVIEEGDCIVLDYGTVYKGMKSDMSRTVFVGSITEEQREIYYLVDLAQLAGQAAAVEGAWIPDIDKAGRAVLDEKGLAHTLVNRIGHGIGYSVHEGPYITQQNFRRLERGMCFSIEPGVYLPGKWGMRIENIVCINENGETEVLNKADRSLRVLDWYKK